VPNTFYTGLITVQDAGGPTTVPLKFDTLTEDSSVAIERKITTTMPASL